mmetsp:Transcript_2890/g.7955  ORF Transcript_2890/g.7955 Transcript_2890/m.7955 type:complete len:153 (+) Transcript_2890:188-646(+)
MMTEKRGYGLFAAVVLVVATMGIWVEGSCISQCQARCVFNMKTSRCSQPVYEYLLPPNFTAPAGSYKLVSRIYYYEAGSFAGTVATELFDDPSECGYCCQVDPVMGIACAFTGVCSSDIQWLSLAGPPCSSVEFMVQDVESENPRKNNNLIW